MQEQVFKKEWHRIGEPLNLLLIVIKMFDEFEASGKAPGAETWATHRDLFRKVVMPEVVKRWSEDSKFDPAFFPWREDFVVYTWVSWRKVMASKEVQVRKHFGLPMPPNREPLFDVG